MPPLFGIAFSGLFVSTAFAAPPITEPVDVIVTNAVNTTVSNTVNSHIVNVIPFDSLRGLGSASGLSPPGTLTFVGLGMAGLGLSRRRKAA